MSFNCRDTLVFHSARAKLACGSGMRILVSGLLLSTTVVVSMVTKAVSDPLLDA